MKWRILQKRPIASISLNDLETFSHSSKLAPRLQMKITKKIHLELGFQKTINCIAFLERLVTFLFQFFLKLFTSNLRKWQCQTNQKIKEIEFSVIAIHRYFGSPWSPLDEVLKIFVKSVQNFFGTFKLQF